MAQGQRGLLGAGGANALERRNDSDGMARRDCTARGRGLGLARCDVK